MILFLFFLSLFLFLPQSCWAWGPITHVDFAWEALQQVSTYGALVKTLLQNFPNDFLYGALAADITLGKDYVDYVHNCHNWRVGFLILNEADDDRQKAAAFGYLSHLAVDIISHNYFVPYKTIRSYPTRTLGHVYWEMRFDAKRPKKIWDLSKKISQLDFSHNDELFERMLRRTIFSFKTNRRIFRSVLTLHRLGQWRSMMGRVHEISRFKLHEKDMEEYRKLAIESVVKFLKDPEKAPCTRVDPTGEAKLLYAKEARHELRRLTQKKLVTQAQAEQFLKKAKIALRETIYLPGDLPTVSDLL
ncbi:MAG: zinc dependent phospholipase C family protein [Deltaproteobacteria bacterium]|nr:zinc dependent phospholipase C family protein [Deltaproteobacteria bacterium]